MQAQVADCLVVCMHMHGAIQQAALAAMPDCCDECNAVSFELQPSKHCNPAHVLY